MARRLVLFGTCRSSFSSKATRHVSTASPEIPAEFENDILNESEAYGKSETLYPHHIPTTWLQKGLLAIGSGLAVFFDPKRDDMIAVLGESTGYFALRRIRRFMQQDPVGQRILRERPRINSSTLNISSLRDMPDGIFGKEYTKFLDKNKISPDTRKPMNKITERFSSTDKCNLEKLEEKAVNASTKQSTKIRVKPGGEQAAPKNETMGKENSSLEDLVKARQIFYAEVRFIDDPELAYVMQRYREIHDFTHALLGMRTNIVGEITVKWFEMIQTGLPMCTLGSFLAPIRLKRREQEKLLKYYIPWAAYAAFRADFFMNVYFEEHLEEPVDLLRQRLNVVPPPVIPKSQNRLV